MLGKVLGRRVRGWGGGWIVENERKKVVMEVGNGGRKM